MTDARIDLPAQIGLTYPENLDILSLMRSMSAPRLGMTGAGEKDDHADQHVSLGRGMVLRRLD